MVKYSTVEEAKAKNKPTKKKKKRVVNGMQLFLDTACWEVLHPEADVVQEPANL